jgi:branched-chain amino acid transport system permease protein
VSGPRFAVVRSTLASRIGLGVAIAVVAIAASVPLWSSPGTMRTLVSFLTLLALAQMWNLLAGYAGLLSVGQQAYVGIGAYALWALADKGGVHPFLAVPLAGLVALVVAVPTAGLAFRLRGGYFAIGTWVIAEVYRLLAANTGRLGGGSGVTISSASQLDMTVRLQGTYWMALVVAVGSVLLVYLVLRSRLGLALTAIRDNEIGARSLGVRTFRTKLYVYLLAAFGSGVTGAVIYLNLLRIQPDAAFSVNWTAFVIFIVVIGGVGTIEGPILGTVIYFGLQETLADYGSWYLVLLGVLAVVITLRARMGLWGLARRFRPIQLFPVQRRLGFLSPEQAEPEETDASHPS